MNTASLHRPSQSAALLVFPLNHQAATDPSHHHIHKPVGGYQQTMSNSPNQGITPEELFGNKQSKEKISVAALLQKAPR